LSYNNTNRRSQHIIYLRSRGNVYLISILFRDWRRYTTQSDNLRQLVTLTGQKPIYHDSGFLYNIVDIWTKCQSFNVHIICVRMINWSFSKRLASKLNRICVLSKYLITILYYQYSQIKCHILITKRTFFRTMVNILIKFCFINMI
jgi:hypothetical protein